MKSTDGGQIWTVINSNFATGVVIDPKKPSTIYAVINDQVYRQHQRWRLLGAGRNRPDRCGERARDGAFQSGCPLRGYL